MDGMGFEGWDIVGTSRGTNDTNNWHYIINGFRNESMGVGEIVNRTGLTAAQAALYAHADYVNPHIHNSQGCIKFHFGHVYGHGIPDMYFLGWSNEAVPNPIIGRQEAVERAMAFAVSDETLAGPGCLLSLSEPYGHKRYACHHARDARHGGGRLGGSARARPHGSAGAGPAAPIPARSTPQVSRRRGACQWPFPGRIAPAGRSSCACPRRGRVSTTGASPRGTGPCP